MRLRDWRKSQTPPLTLTQAAPLFKLPVSSLSDIETGKAEGVSWETMTRIEAVTRGKVTAVDLYRDWRILHLDLFTELKAAARLAWKAFRGGKGK